MSSTLKAREFFCKHKGWISWYVQFYSNQIISNWKQFYSVSSDIKSKFDSAITLLITYIKSWSWKNTNYVIENSELIEIFDYPIIWQNIAMELSALVEVQLASNYYHIEFLDKYFYNMISWKALNNYRLTKNIITQLLLYSYINSAKKDEFKEMAIDYIIAFFWCVYESEAENKTENKEEIICIFSWSFQFFPEIMIKISEIIATKKKECIINPEIEMPFEEEKIILARRMFMGELQQAYRKCSAINVPKPFTDFIDNLVNYLRSGSEISLREMGGIFFNYNDGYNIEKIDYGNEEYPAKVLIHICWTSEFISKRWIELKNKESKRLEEEEESKKSEQKIELELDHHDSDKIENLNSEDFKGISEYTEIIDEAKCEIERKANATEIFSIEDAHCSDLFSLDFNGYKPLRKKKWTKTDREINTTEEKIKEESKEIHHNEKISISSTYTNFELDHNDLCLQIQFFEDLKTSFIIKMLFESNQIVKKWLISQLSNLFSLTIKNKSSFIYDTASIAIKLISQPVTETNINQYKLFKRLCNSKVVKEWLGKIGLNLDMSEKRHINVWFASLPEDLEGITIFGGDIIINSKYRDESSKLNLCAQKIIFLRELVHYLRKAKDGFYNIKQKTPPSDKGNLYKGIPGSNKLTCLRSTNEGGWQLESELFSVFVVKICDIQLDFLNTDVSWELSLENFKGTLQALYSKHSNKYQLGRCSGGMYYLKRRGHNNN